MDLRKLRKKLLAGESIYLLDDFEETAIRLIYEDGFTKAFIKHRRRNEISVPQSNETVCEIILSGKEITKSEYNEY